MQEAAQRGQRIWEKLHLAVEEAICFVEDQGLHVLEAADLLKVTGTVPYEAIVIHGWLNRHWPAITRLLEAQAFEPILSIRSELATLLELQRVEEPATPGIIRWKYRGRALKDEDMAIISLLVDNEPPTVRKKLLDEALTIGDVVSMEREAINAALHRHGESKRVAKERRAQAAAHSVKRPAGGPVPAANPRRRAKAGRQA
ncbi:hypothetical protein [Sorangium sp. So ce1151]|uniref:hypothetical protein n=1 Tax=Sorangium sp. So ce1151 TaxID=3133332 RepID=UPI003F5EE284